MNEGISAEQVARLPKYDFVRWTCFSGLWDVDSSYSGTRLEQNTHVDNEPLHLLCGWCPQHGDTEENLLKGWASSEQDKI